jgi:6-pyruvoyl-tetrahydropterin synthase
VTVYVLSTVNKDTGMGVDYELLAKQWQPLHDKFDHHCLNDHFENPTSEMLALHVWRHFECLGVTRVRVREGDDNQCDYRGTA